MRRAALIIAGFASALSGCTMGPDYAAPQSTLPPTYGEPQPVAREAVDPAHWWTIFDDSELTSLVERALADNPSIELAASRVRQARLQEIEARGVGLPTVDAMANATNVRFSKNAGFSSIAKAFGGQSGSGSGSTGGSSSSGGVALPGESIATFAVGFDASWELDLFGLGARTREAALAASEAAVWTGRDAAVTLAAEVADAYFAYRLDEAQMAALKEEIADQRRSVALAAHRAEAGLAPAIEAVRQDKNVAITQARLLPLEADARIRVHALGILLGKGPKEVSDELAKPLPALGPVPAIPAGLPSDLLRRRPDIRAAERRIAAASAQIGVATADLYPRFSLTGLAELISTNLATLFQGDSLQTTASAGAMFPILDWGRRKAVVHEREEDRTQAYLEYQQTVLTALKDVEDALVRIDKERARRTVLERALADAERSARSTEAQYRTGLVAEDPVLDARVQVLVAREQLASSEAQLRQQTAALFKALGGGWSE
jgi:NodT family efflux transporter outer membrane factor (OMF) lipoprotein